MKKLFSLLMPFFLFIVCLCLSNCKKKIDKLNIVLYNKSLFVIQKYIQGRWELIYGKGGISANNIQYYHDDLWDFDNNRVRILSNGNVFADTTIQWSYEMGSYTNGGYTYVMNFYDKRNVPSVYVVDRIYNDTLILHDLASDAVFFHFIKSN